MDNSEFVYIKTRFDKSELDKDLLSRAAMECMSRQQRIQKSNPDYITIESEARFKRRLKESDLQIYNQYTLAKIYHHIRIAHFIDLNKMIGYFYDRGDDVFLADLQIIELNIKRWDFSHIFGKKVETETISTNVRGNDERRSYSKLLRSPTVKNSNGNEVDGNFLWSSFKKSSLATRVLLSTNEDTSLGPIMNMNSFDIVGTISSSFSIRRGRIYKKYENIAENELAPRSQSQNQSPLIRSKRKFLQSPRKLTPSVKKRDFLSKSQNLKKTPKKQFFLRRSIGEGYSFKSIIRDEKAKQELRAGIGLEEIMSTKKNDHFLSFFNTRKQQSKIESGAATRIKAIMREGNERIATVSYDEQQKVSIRNSNLSKGVDSTVCKALEKQFKGGRVFSAQIELLIQKKIQNARESKALGINLLQKLTKQRRSKNRAIKRRFKNKSEFTVANLVLGHRSCDEYDEDSFIEAETKKKLGKTFKYL